jgi:hypothetical protein
VAAPWGPVVEWVVVASAVPEAGWAAAGAEGTEGRR